ncbi:hypothetical protein [Candidatus Frankia alpina]|nr:hypothetical protein [Candidatus Frankia alpina]
MDAVAARRLIAADAVVDAERFADLAIPLKDLATTA